MIKSLFESPVSLFYAVLIHVGLIVMLVFSVDWSIEEDVLPKYKVVQATVVDESKIAKQIKDLKKNEKKKRREEDKRLEKERKQAEREKAKQQKEEKRRAEALVEKQRRLELEKKRRREERKAAKNQPPKVDKPKEKKPIKKPEPKDDAAEKRRAKIKADKQRRDTIAKEKKAKEKQDEARRQKDQDEMMKQLLAEEDAMRQQELEIEQAAIDNAQVSENMTRVQMISAMIQQRITDNWRRNTAAGLKKDLSCILYVKLMPTGDLLHVEITKSSGDDVFDKSVENAVRKAAPFPLPLDVSDIFDQIRELNIEFDPNKV